MSSANCILLHFSLKSNEETPPKETIRVIKENVQQVFGESKIICETWLDDGVLSISINKNEVIFILRKYPNNLITLNIEYFKHETELENNYFSVSAE